MTAVDRVTERKLAVRDGRFDIDLLEGGSGDPLLFLHGIAGLEWDGCLEALASQRHVYAPRTPGFGESTGSEELHDVQDLTYFYLDLLDALGLDSLPLVGHSFGGMVAAELASVQPQRFTKVVLIAPFGLWSDDHQVVDYFAIPPGELAQAMYHDQESEAAQQMAGGPSSPTLTQPTRVRMPDAGPDSAEGQAVIDYYLERNRSMATAAKYLWPIPNKGLKRRIHRMSQPTLIVWGEHDGLIPPAYGEDFRALIPGSRLELVPDAAHLVTAEQPERVAELVNGFLAES